MALKIRPRSLGNGTWRSLGNKFRIGYSGKKPARHIEGSRARYALWPGQAVFPDVPGPPDKAPSFLVVVEDIRVKALCSLYNDPLSPLFLPWPWWQG
jgi:hypothetical protein